MPEPQVSVIIPVRNGASTLPGCLDALALQVDAPAFEVIVVDNGSKDGTGGLARAHPVGATVVSEAVPGSYRARNAGVARARGRLLAFTDADCVPSPTWLARACSALESGEADIVGGAVTMAPSPHPTTWELWDAAHYLDQEAFVSDGFAATANLVTTRSTMERTGPFDEQLLSSGDLEWCRRAVAGGARITYGAAAVVTHRPRTTRAQTWSLHRRLGAGWHVLAARGQRPPAWRDPWMRPSLAEVTAAIVRGGTPIRRRAVLPVHVTVIAARWVGRASGR